MKRKVEELSDLLENRARDERDLETAQLLRRLSKGYELGREIVMARTNQGSQAAYAELVDFFKGKRDG